ncbi:MAG: hypothetical protein ACU843_06795 [Gammaproteobacteria bacterium]
MTICKWIFSIPCLLSAFAVSADSRQITEYRYDPRGAITHTFSEVSDQAPLITDITPTVLRQGRQHPIIANGAGLRKVQISADDPDLVISDVQSDNLQVRFTIIVGNSAVLGEHSLTFATRLGSTIQSITVFPPLPEITLNPAPIGAPVSGLPVDLDIRLNKPDIVDHSLVLRVDNPDIAETQPGSVTIAAGSTRADEAVRIRGLQKGASTLTLSSTTLDPFSTRIFVTEPYRPEPGSHSTFSEPVGILRGQNASPPALFLRGPFATRLGISKPASALAGDTRLPPLLSTSLGVAKGAVVFGLNPRVLIADGQPVQIKIFGTRLAGIEKVAIDPPDGISIGPLMIAADGSFVTFTVTVEPGVTLGLRRIILILGNEKILAIDPQAVQIAIVRGAPEIEAIDPIVVTRFSKNEMVIRGKNFDFSPALKIMPAEGITIAQPIQVSANRNEIRAAIAVDELAPLGDRIVSVETGAGVTSSLPSPDNTLTVVNGPTRQTDSLVAPLLGVLRTTDPREKPSPLDVRNPPLGVVRGTHIASLSPATQPIGSDFILTISGSGFNTVDSVTFVPADGLFTGIPSVAGDGSSLRVPVSIGFDAQPILRRVLVQSQNSTIQASPVGADRFQVTGFAPVITSLSPNFLVAGEDFVRLQIRGRMLHGVTSVAVLPSEDLIIGPPMVNAEGTVVTLDIRAGSLARIGLRSLIVTTADGDSSDSQSPANLLQILATAPTEFNALVSATVGIEKRATSLPRTGSERLISTSLLGIVRNTPPLPGTPTELHHHSGPLGVLVGAAVTGLFPRLASVGNRVMLTIDGFGLDQVTNLSLNPPDGLLVADSFSIDATGRQLTVSVEVSPDAQLTEREIILATMRGKLPFVDNENSRLMITGLLPIIQSIDPIQQFPGSSLMLTVRGLNLQNAIAIKSTPGDGIDFGSIQVNPEGSQLQAPMVILPTAPTGPRVISVLTQAGTTDSRATPANTFTVLPSS